MRQKSSHSSQKQFSKAIVDLTEEASQASIPYWRRDNLRNSLKALKKKLDDLDRQRKANLVNDVVDEAKCLIAAHSNDVFIVQLLAAQSNGKALDAAMKQFKTQAPHMACMFFSVDEDAGKILCMSCVPEELVSRGLKAHEWVAQVQDLMAGKGGGKDTSAQATGTNVRCLSRAMQLTTEYAAGKLNAANLSTSGGDRMRSCLAAVNAHLMNRSYIVGYQPSQADTTVYKAVSDQSLPAEFVHLVRWYKHICSYGNDINRFPGTKQTMVELGFHDDANPAVSSYAQNEDDDFELFGSDDEAESAAAQRLKEERIRVYEEKKKKKEAVVAKSNIILDVKPWDDETNMADMENAVRSIAADGLLWGASKLVPLAYGIHKLQISCVVEDDKIGVDFLEEEITKHEDLVQSVDVAAFNKI